MIISIISFILIVIINNIVINACNEVNDTLIGVNEVIDISKYQNIRDHSRKICKLKYNNNIM